VEVEARHKELLTSPMGTSCQKATPHEGNEINYVILVAAPALAAYWSWGHTQDGPLEI